MRRSSFLWSIAKKRVFPSASQSPETPLFDGCFVINLDRRTDRWQHVCNQIRRANLGVLLPLTTTLIDANKTAEAVTVVKPDTTHTFTGSSGDHKHNNNNKIPFIHKSPFPSVERISGIDGNKLDINDLYKDGYVTKEAVQRLGLPIEEKLFGMDLTLGAIGCALSHMSVWRIIAERGLDRALVLEDDVEFTPRFHKIIHTRLEVVPDDYDIVYFGGLDLLAAGKAPRRYVADGVRLAYEGHRELTAYVIHSDAAARCLEMSKPMTWQIDTHITSNVKAEDSLISLSSSSSFTNTHNDDGIQQNNNNNNEGGNRSFYISNPLSYVLQPSVAIQITSMGTDVQKKAADNPALEDASRRMREFVGGGTSVR